MCNTVSKYLVLLLIPVLLLLGGCESVPERVEQVIIAYPPPPEQPRIFFERTLTGTGAVKPLSDEENLKALLTGTATQRGTAFAKPFDVAAHKGRLYVTDTVQRSVLVMDFIEERSFEFGDKGDDGDLHKPLGITVDRSGNVYVCDGSLKRVLVYDRDGNYLRSIGDSDVLSRPSGIDVDPQGERLYVVDTGGVRSKDHHIRVFDTATGKVINTIGTRGTGSGEFNLPRDVSLGADGLLYISDGGNFRVQVMTKEGKFVREWGKAGARFGQFSRPKGIATDKQGNIYAVDAAFGNFQIFNSEGQLLLFVGNRSTTPGSGKYMLPAGIDVDEDGRIYMVDQFFSKVDIFRPADLAESQGYLGKKRIEDSAE